MRASQLNSEFSQSYCVARRGSFTAPAPVALLALSAEGLTEGKPADNVFGLLRTRAGVRGSLCGADMVCGAGIVQLTTDKEDWRCF
jgi:hypothetical protein